MRSNERWEGWVEEVLRGTHEPSRRAVDRALAAFATRAPRRSRDPRAWVELLFDSALEPAVAGVRDTATGERRLFYRVRPPQFPDEVFELDLQVARVMGGTLQLTGQLLPQLDGASIEARSPRFRRKRRIGRLGQFLFRHVPSEAESLELRVHIGRGECIEIPDIPLVLVEGDSELPLRP